MAKLSSKRFSEVARITTEFGGSDLRTPARYLWVYRSDGRVLRRRTGDLGSSYTIFDHLSPTIDKAIALTRLRSIAAERDHKIVAEK
jgi:2-keto-3-deoxy-galactonokinase